MFLKSLMQKFALLNGNWYEKARCENTSLVFMHKSMNPQQFPAPPAPRKLVCTRRFEPPVCLCACLQLLLGNNGLAFLSHFPVSREDLSPLTQTRSHLGKGVLGNGGPSFSSAMQESWQQVVVMPGQQSTAQHDLLQELLLKLNETTQINSQ